MILFKTCPRCGGDVDASYEEDVYCIQCAYRPAVAFPGPRVVTAGGVDRQRPPAANQATVAMNETGVLCGKCASALVIALDKVRANDNSCYRCQACGHIFSPRRGSTERDIPPRRAGLDACRPQRRQTGER